MTRSALTFLASVFVFLVVIFEGGKLVLTFTPPVVFFSVRAVTPEVEQGGTLLLSYTFDRSRICRTDLDRFILAEPNNRVVWRNTVPGGPGEVGRITVENPVVLPKDLPPGKYSFLTMAYFECYEGLHSATHPPIPFTIKKKGSKR